MNFARSVAVLCRIARVVDVINLIRCKAVVDGVRPDALMLDDCQRRHDTSQRVSDDLTRCQAVNVTL